MIEDVFVVRIHKSPTWMSFVSKCSGGVACLDPIDFDVFVHSDQVVSILLRSRFGTI